MLWYQVVCTNLMPQTTMNRLVASMQISKNQPEHRLHRLLEQGGEDADADMQMLAIADHGRQERQHDHQKDGHRLRP